MKIIHYTIVLGVICLIAAFGVAGTFRMTKTNIDEKAEADKAAAQSVALGIEAGSQVSFETINADVAKALNTSGEVLGYAAVAEAQGYGGKVQVMVGMDTRGEKIIGLKIVQQSETPGLGSRIEEIKSDKTWFRILTGRAGNAKQETMPEFLKQFIGRTPENVRLEGANSIQAITGATISSAALVVATRSAVEKIRNARPEGANSIQAITGATISSTPDVDATRNAVEKIRNTAE